jgi:hypothetical protein
VTDVGAVPTDGLTTTGQLANSSYSTNTTSNHTVVVDTITAHSQVRSKFGFFKNSKLDWTDAVFQDAQDMVYALTSDLTSEANDALALSKAAVKDFKARQKEVKRALRPEKRGVHRALGKLKKNRSSGHIDPIVESDYQTQAEAQ